MPVISPQSQLLSDSSKDSASTLARAMLGNEVETSHHAKTSSGLTTLAGRHSLGLRLCDVFKSTTVVIYDGVVDKANEKLTGDKVDMARRIIGQCGGIEMTYSESSVQMAQLIVFGYPSYERLDDFAMSLQVPRSRCVPYAWIRACFEYERRLALPVVPMDLIRSGGTEKKKPPPTAKYLDRYWRLLPVAQKLRHRKEKLERKLQSIVEKTSEEIDVSAARNIRRLFQTCWELDEASLDVSDYHQVERDEYIAQLRSKSPYNVSANGSSLHSTPSLPDPGSASQLRRSKQPDPIEGHDCVVRTAASPTQSCFSVATISKPQRRTEAPLVERGDERILDVKSLPDTAEGDASNLSLLVGVAIGTSSPGVEEEQLNCPDPPHPHVSREVGRVDEATEQCVHLEDPPPSTRELSPLPVPSYVEHTGLSYEPPAPPSDNYSTPVQSQLDISREANGLRSAKKRPYSAVMEDDPAIREFFPTLDFNQQLEIDFAFEDPDKMMLPPGFAADDLARIKNNDPLPVAMVLFVLLLCRKLNDAPPSSKSNRRQLASTDGLAYAATPQATFLDPMDAEMAGDTIREGTHATGYDTTGDVVVPFHSGDPVTHWTACVIHRDTNTTTLYDPSPDYSVTEDSHELDHYLKAISPYLNTPKSVIIRRPARHWIDPPLRDPSNGGLAVCNLLEFIAHNGVADLDTYNAWEDWQAKRERMLCRVLGL